MREYALLVGVTAPIVCAAGAFLSAAISTVLTQLALAF